MINVKTKEELPEVYRLVREQNDGSFNVYFEDDPEIIEGDLREAKSDKYQQIDAAIKADIANGFTASNGSIYSLDNEDINDLNSLIALGVPNDYKVKTGQRGKFRLHTLQELKQVRDEGIIYKLNAYKKHEALIDQITAATTKAEVEAITW